MTDLTALTIAEARDGLAHGAMDPAALAKLVRRVLVLSELSGRLAAAEQARVAQNGLERSGERVARRGRRFESCPGR